MGSIYLTVSASGSDLRSLVSAHHEPFEHDSHRSVLERADSILGSFDADHASLSLQGLMARTGLPKTSAYRLIQKMVELRWLERHDGRYRIGTRFFEVSRKVTAEERWILANKRRRRPKPDPRTYGALRGS